MGRIRTTVFFKGCDLRCWWCHNPEASIPGPELLLRPELCIQCGACLAECARRAIQRNGEHLVTDRELCDRCGTCSAACAAGARAMAGRAMTVEQVMDDVLRWFFTTSPAAASCFSGGEPLLRVISLDLLRACKAHDLHTIVDTRGAAPRRRSTACAHMWTCSYTT
jgi:pyruvate formate lyase activating enzyme